MISSLQVFLQLLKRDLVIFRREFSHKFIDTCILFLTNVIVTAYLMTQQWVNPSFGPFMVIGAIASFGLIEVVGKVSIFMYDIDGDRTISQILILPARSEALFAYFGMYWGLTSMLLSILLFPIGKLLLFTQFNFSEISYLRLIPMYLSANIFYGFFTLWLASILKSSRNINSLWQRFIGPMWMFGAYFNSWQAFYELSPVIGYLSLINPMVYIMEGMRAAALGQEGYLPFWVSFVVLWGFTFACGIHAIRRLKKQLDCV